MERGKGRGGQLARMFCEGYPLVAVIRDLPPGFVDAQHYKSKEGKQSCLVHIQDNRL